MDMLVTAPGGEEISYLNTVDSVTQGYLVQDVIPSVPGSYTETVIIPAAPPGVYRVVMRYNQKTNGEINDFFELNRAVYFGTDVFARFVVSGRGNGITALTNMNTQL